MERQRIEEREWEIASEVDDALRERYRKIDRIAVRNQEKVLAAFWEAGIGDHHFFGSTGYGYDDGGRERLERVFAKAFAAEAALVRPHLASGTHALGVAYFGLLRPGDTLLYATGQPYDTLQTVIGEPVSTVGSLKEFGVRYREVKLLPDGGIDVDGMLAAIDQSVRVVAFQRSPGYAWRRAMSVAELGVAIQAVKRAYPQVYVVVDNCYGEFTEWEEPTAYGADLAVGSLIKNPGGGLAPTGGYLVGTQQAVDLAGYRLTAPGIGREVGSYENYRLFFQGLFMAPHTVGQALKGNLFASELLRRHGYACSPGATEDIRDIVLKIRLGSRDRLITFCKAIQSASPVNSHVAPEPWAMPGYQDPVIMAAGTFVQGASIELSADGPVKPPYVAYLQGGLTLAHVQVALLMALRRLGSQT